MIDNKTIVSPLPSRIRDLEVSYSVGDCMGLSDWAAFEAGIVKGLDAAANILEQELIGWQPMETAPTNGRHCILAVREGAFIYSVQGSFDGRKWNVVHREDVQPLCWMPNVLLPKEFLPEGF